MLHHKLPIKSIANTKHHFVIALITSGVYAFSLYAFAFVIREGIRICSVNYFYEFWEFTSEEIQFYNLFFAFVAVVQGQSVFFSIWLNYPSRFKNIRNRTSVYIDQTILNWTFLYWYLQLSLCFSIMFALSRKKGYLDFSLYPDYKLLFLGIGLVLYLHTWTTIRRVFKKISGKLIMLSLVMSVLLSLSLSQINLVKIDDLNEAIHRKSILYDCNLEYPSINNAYDLNMLSELYNFRFYRIDVIIGMPKEHVSSKRPVMRIWDQPATIRDIGSNKFERLVLYADRHVPMSLINELIDTAAATNFSVRPAIVVESIGQKAGSLHESKYYLNLPYKYDRDFRQPYSQSTKIVPVYIKNDRVYIGEEEILYKDLPQYFEDFDQNIKKVVFQVGFEDDCTLARFVVVINAIYNFIYSQQNYHANSMFEMEYQQLNDAQKDSIRTRCSVGLEY